MNEAPTQTRLPDRGQARLAGAAAAGLSLGLTELTAGLFGSVPSATAAVGGYVVDVSPKVVRDVAISVFGTADKGALAIGTAIITLIIGAIVGRLAVRRPWVATLAFGGFAVLGIGAALTEPLISPVATVLVIGLAALAGWWALRKMLAPRPVDSPSDHVPADAGRRRFVTQVAAVGAAAVVAGSVGRSMIIRRSEEVRVDATLPEPVTRVLPPGPDAALDVVGLSPIVTPNDQFYRIDTALVVPGINPDVWRLEVTGLVDRELELSLADLKQMALHEEYVTISCVSNKVGGGLVGNAKWTGVKLTDVLDMAGVRPEATQIVGRSVDEWTAGFPTEVAYDGREPLIALGMNGEPLPRRHGFPARLIVPGLYGYVSATKWLQEIELTTWEDFDGYWVPRGWSKTGPIKTQSRIDYPRKGEQITGKPAVAAGVAWAPTRGISGVEVRFNNGPWIPAQLTTPLSDGAWVQWKVETEIAPGDYTVTVRATDGTGQTQTSEVSEPAPDGATGYHHIEFVAV